MRALLYSFCGLFALACGGAVAPVSSSSDGGTPGTESPVDASPVSSSQPGKTLPNPSPLPATTTCSPCLGAAIVWYWDGGEVLYTDSSRLSACRRYEHTRFWRDSNNPGACSGQIGDCSATSPSVREVEAALADADVTKALASGIVLYGSDPRCYDGAVFAIQIGDSRLQVGGDCSNASTCGTNPCVPVPPGLKSLTDLLQRIDSAEFATSPGCEIFR